MTESTHNMGNTDQLLTCLHAWQASGGMVTSGVEIGVHVGSTSRKLLAAFPQLNLYMVDPWAVYPPYHPYFLSGDSLSRRTEEEQDAYYHAANRNTQQFQNRRTILRLTSEKAAERLQGRQFSFVFIDGDHTYEAVSRDIELWWPKIAPPGETLVYAAGNEIGGIEGAEVPINERAKVDPLHVRKRTWPGGVLCGHDIDHPRDKRGIWGVRRAVQEFADREGVSVGIDGEFWWCEKQQVGAAEI